MSLKAQKEMINGSTEITDKALWHDPSNTVSKSVSKSGLWVTPFKLNEPEGWKSMLEWSRNANFPKM